MNQQEELESRYRANATPEAVPKEDPFPKMIVVCVAITLTLLFIIMGCLFVDFVLLRPGQNVRPTPSVAVEGAPQSGGEVR